MEWVLKSFDIILYILEWSFLPRIHDHCRQTPQNAAHWNDQHDPVPEPKYHVNFLMNYIQRHDTKCIVSLNWSRMTIFIKIALGHFGEDRIKNIHRSGEIIFHKFESKCIKLAAKENVCCINLHNQIDEIHDFAQNEACRKLFIDSDVFVKIVFNQMNSAFNHIVAR